MIVMTLRGSLTDVDESVVYSRCWRHGFHILHSGRDTLWAIADSLDCVLFPSVVRVLSLFHVHPKSILHFASRHFLIKNPLPITELYLSHVTSSQSQPSESH